MDHQLFLFISLFMSDLISILRILSCLLFSLTFPELAWATFLVGFALSGENLHAITALTGHKTLLILPIKSSTAMIPE